MKQIMLFAPLALSQFALAACSAEPPAERPPVGPAAAVTGPAQSCIQLTDARETRIRDDWTIDFVRGGKRAWRNTLPHRCSGLKFDDAFSYATSLSQLCSTDIIYPLQRTGGTLQRGAGCGLGQFVPVELAD